MDLHRAFTELAPANSAVDYTALPLSVRRRDFLAKSSNGGPVFLLHDASAATYSPSITLKNVSVQFHSTCRITTAAGTIEDQFAVVVCDSSIPDLYEMFIRCFAATTEQLPDTTNTAELGECVRGLFNLFSALNRPGSKEVIGLWAELFLIRACRNTAHALESWHSDPLERFDFSWPGGCLEVKATASQVRTHNFSLEQLEAPINGGGFVASLLLQPISGGIGVMDLAREIETQLLQQPKLRQKLWENLANTLGMDFSDAVDRRFDASYAERHLFLYSMKDIPAPENPTDARVTDLRFKSDLSGVLSSLNGAPGELLARIFERTVLL